MNAPEPVNDQSRPAAEPAPAQRGRRKLGSLLAALILLVLGWGVWTHYLRHTEAQAALEERQNYVPTVRVATVARTGAGIELNLPGTTEAFDVATVNARATGYIARRLVDIGSRVAAGDVLAVIDTPDLDQQLDQARSQLAQTKASLAQAQAALQQAKSNYNLAEVTNARYAKLVDQGWAAKQLGDQYRLQFEAQASAVQNADAAVSVAAANEAAQEAAVRRLAQLVDYQKMIAPFAGVVTARNVDTGDLVAADTNSGTGLFTVARDDVLRVRIDVPQNAVEGLTDGLAAIVTVPDTPGRSFKGKVARNAVALASGSRTLRTEVDIENADHALRPGLYVNVRLTVPRHAPSVVIPEEALIFNDQGPEVAIVDAGVVKLRHVDIRRDFGTSVEIGNGLNGGETIILSPFAAITDGQKVKLQAPPQSAPIT